MGCSVGQGLVKSSNGVQLGISSAVVQIEDGKIGAENMPLTDHEILLIQKSWESLSGDMTSKGMRIFKEIFARDPDAKALFPFRNARMEDLPNDVKFRGHASRFMQAIGAAVDNIHSLDENLSPLLIELGRVHGESVMFDAKYFKLFKDVILATFEEDLGKKNTHEMEVAWNKITTFMMVKLLEGMAEAKRQKDTPH